MADDDVLCGTNELRLNPQTMRAALEYYLDNQVFGDHVPGVEVTMVEQRSTNPGTEFVIRFHFPEDDTPDA